MDTSRGDGVGRTPATYKVLDLGHRELAHAQQAVLRRDFVPKAQADLRRREGDTAVVVV